MINRLFRLSSCHARSDVEMNINVEEKKNEKGRFIKKKSILYLGLLRALSDT